MKKNVLSILFLLISMTTLAQDFKADWSKRIEYDRKTTGGVESFSGANEKNIYATFMPVVRKLALKNRVLMAFDKQNMKQIGKVNLVSKGKANFYNVCVTEDVIYVLYIDDQKGKEIMFAETYSTNLKKISTYKKIFQVSTSTKFGSRFIHSMYATCNSKANSDLYLVSEKPNAKDENVKIDYSVFGSDLAVKYTNKIELPVKSVRNTAYRLSSITVGDEGDIICKNSIKASSEERKEDKIYSYGILSSIDPKSGVIKSLPIKASGKHISDFEFFTKDGNLNVVGFYSETLGKRSERGSGVFLSTLNKTTGELENTEFTEVDIKGLSFGLLYLEKVKHDSNGNVYLYATEDQNIEITTTDSRGNTRTTYKNIKGDILSVCLTKTGSLKWKSLTKRNITYPSLYVRDMQVVSNDQNAFVTYVDQFTLGKKRNIFNRKRFKNLKQEINYAKIDIETGLLSKKVYKLNSASASKESKRYVNATSLTEIDNKLYMNGFRTRRKTGHTIFSIATSPILIGVVYYYVLHLNGSLYKGGGQLGAIKLK